MDADFPHRLHESTEQVMENRPWPALGPHCLPPSPRAPLLQDTLIGRLTNHP